MAIEAERRADEHRRRRQAAQARRHTFLAEPPPPGGDNTQHQGERGNDLAGGAQPGIEIGQRRQPHRKAGVDRIVACTLQGDDEVVVVLALADAFNRLFVKGDVLIVGFVRCACLAGSGHGPFDRAEPRRTAAWLGDRDERGGQKQRRQCSQRNAREQRRPAGETVGVHSASEDALVLR